MSSLFDSINAYDIKPFKRMGITVDEEIYYYKYVSKFILSLSPERVVELSCGNCLITKIVRQSMKKGDVIGIDDWKDENIEKWTKSVKGEIDIVQNLFPLPFRSSSIDLIYAVLYFYNVPKKERKEKIEEIRRVLKDDHYLIIVDLDIVRNMRKDFPFKEEYFHQDQGIFISIMKKEKRSLS